MSDWKINPESLKAAGYSGPWADSLGHADFFYQHWIPTPLGALPISPRGFMLNVYIYDWRDEKKYPGRNGDPVTAEARVTFYPKSHPADLSGVSEVMLSLGRYIEIAEVEKWFSGVYIAMDCRPDIHNQQGGAE